MLLLKQTLCVVFFILFSALLIGQIEFLACHDNDTGGDYLLPSTIEGNVVFSLQTLNNVTNPEIIELDYKLEIYNKFEIPFDLYPNASIHQLGYLNQDSYLLLLTCNDNKTVIDQSNRKVMFMIIDKNLSDYRVIEVIDIKENEILSNATVVEYSNFKRYFFTIYNPQSWEDVKLQYVDFDLISEGIVDVGISSINPHLIYKDTEIHNGDIYFVDGLGGFHKKSFIDTSIIAFLMNWPKQGLHFHHLHDMHFEILSNGKIIFSAEYDYDFNDFGNIHGIAVFDLYSLDSMGFQNPPLQFYEYDGQQTSRAWTNSITKVPNKDEVWIYGANMDLLDIFWPELPDKNTTLFLSKLNGDGVKEFTVDVPMEGYAFPTNCTSDKDGNVYATGFIYNEQDCVFRKGFVVKLNSKGELSSSVEIPLEDVLSVYPNPVTDKLYLDGIGRGRYKLMTIEGKVVETGDFDNQVIDMSHLTKGPYIVAIEQEGQIVFKKIIKE